MKHKPHNVVSVSSGTFHVLNRNLERSCKPLSFEFEFVNTLLESTLATRLCYSVQLSVSTMFLASLFSNDCAQLVVHDVSNKKTQLPTSRYSTKTKHILESDRNLGREVFQQNLEVFPYPQIGFCSTPGPIYSGYFALDKVV